MDDLDLHTWQIKPWDASRNPPREAPNMPQHTRSSPQRTRRESAPARLEANDLQATSNWHLVDVDFPGNDGCIRQRSEEPGAATDYVEVEVDLRKNVKLETNEAFLPLAKKRDLSACS